MIDSDDDSINSVARLTTQPKCIVGGTMRPYQIEGLNWLIALYNNGINGILADEMGLGKTVQVLSFLKLISQHNQHRFLIVVPSSLVYNWENEVKEWCKNITYLLFVICE